jgi:hypothetical protein
LIVLWPAFGGHDLSLTVSLFCVPAGTMIKDIAYRRWVWAKPKLAGNQSGGLLNNEHWNQEAAHNLREWRG